MALEDAAADEEMVILDTDLISTVVYSRHYYGTCPEWIEAEARARKADLYLLTDVDVPWTIDDVRDSAAPREILHREFLIGLANFGANFVAIRGNREVRFLEAIKQLDSLRDRPPATARTPHR